MEEADPNHPEAAGDSICGGQLCVGGEGLQG